MDFLSTLIASVGLAIASFFAPPPAIPEPDFGAALPSATAIFETSLAAPISSSATSLTLTANTVRGGGQVSGYTCFTIDEGSSQAEFVCGIVADTAVTSLSRGMSPLTGTTTDTDLQFSHRRGASVKITDFPLIQILKAQNNGQDTFPNILKYATHPTFTATTDIVDKKYVDDTAFSGAAVIDATVAARGVVELATGAEAAASTPTGSSGPLALPASLATSTYNSATAANVIVATGGTGKIDSNFVATTSLFTVGAASTTLTNNGANVFSWSRPTTLFATTSPAAQEIIVSGTASTTILNTTVPAGILGTGNAIRLTAEVSQMTFNTGGTDTFTLEATYGNATTTLLATKVGATNIDTQQGKIQFIIAAAGATNAQKRSVAIRTLEDGVAVDLGSVDFVNRIATSTSAVDSTAAQPLRLVGSFTSGSGDTLSISSILAEILTY